MSTTLRRCATLLLALAFISVPAAAEFHSWTDGDGERRISNVAPGGVDEHGRLRRGHHPNSVAAQHAALRARLAREGQLIAAEEAARAAATRTPASILPDWLGGETPASADSPERW